jgi:DNA-binding NarL/FixJ family response regulator
MGRVRILIADDHTMIAAGFQKLLEPRYEVVGCVADGLLKTSKPSELLQAIHDVVKGNSYVTPPVKRAMGERFIRDPKRPRQKQLTARQREVLQMVAEGRSMMEIANVLQITHRTVRFHKARIMEELEITNNSDLVRYAINHGVISAV